MGNKLMKHLNFNLADSIGLSYKGSYFDLHSNFDFSSMHYNADDQSLILSWIKSHEEWAKIETCNEVSIIFKLVEVLKIIPREDDKPKSEDTTLSFMGYLHPDDLDIMNGFLPTEQKSEDYHMIFGFESGLSIKVYAETVYIQVI